MADLEQTFHTYVNNQSNKSLRIGFESMSAMPHMHKTQLDQYFATKLN